MSETNSNPDLLPNYFLTQFFAQVKNRLKKEQPAIRFTWSNMVLEEINPNVERTLSKKFANCDNGYKATKLAAAYCFWIAKLKPGFGTDAAPLYVNEYLGYKVAMTIMEDRLSLKMVPSQDAVMDLCDVLRYHTTSPSILTELFTAWENESRLSQNIVLLENQLKNKH